MPSLQTLPWFPLCPRGLKEAGIAMREEEEKKTQRYCLQTYVGLPACPVNESSTTQLHERDGLAMPMLGFIFESV